MTKAVADIIKPIFTRIDSSANWKTLNPVPKNGEQCIEVLNGGLFKLKIGDGVTPWIALKYWTSDNDVNVRDIQVDGVSVVDNEKIANIDLTGKIDHFEVMPEITEEMDNLIAQYVGETDTDYINGYWYKAHYDFTNPRNCYWEQIKIQSDEDKQDKDYTEVYKVGFNGGWETANTIINTGSYVVKTDNENGSTTLSIDNVIDNGSEITDDNTGLTTGKAVYEHVSTVSTDKQDKDFTEIYKVGLNGSWATANIIANEGTHISKTNNSDGSFTISVDDITDDGNSITDNDTGLTTGKAIYEYVDTVANNKVDKTNIINQLYGTDENGDQTTYDLDLFGSVDDVQLHGQSVVTNKIANLDAIRQVTILPAEPLINGEIVQYIGTTNSNYTNGYFYKQTGIDTNTWIWEQIKVQPDIEIVDNLTSTLTTSALSANMGRELQEEIETLQARGRYLSIWNCETGLPETNPLYSPYEYRSGDYFIVGSVGTTNYKPNGLQYVINVASTTIETEDVAVNDTYIYDGTTWILQSTSIREISFSSIVGDPYDNTNLANALNEKVSDVQINGTSIVVDNIANIELEASDIEYTNEQYPSMQTIQDAMDRLLYITPTISITGGGNYEIGSTRATTTLTWNWNKTIISQSLNQGIGSLDPTLRTYTYNIPITSNTTFTISGTDGTTTKSASTSITFLPKRYWGVSANTSLTDADILALSQELSTSRTQTRTFDCSGGKYFYFIIRTSYCSGISFKVNGLAFSDMDLEIRNVVNAQGYSASYNIYRVHNIQTGSGIEVQVL